MEDLRAVLDHAGCGEVALFGISEGGPMCQLFAATHPDRVRALVLYGTYAHRGGGRLPDRNPRRGLDAWRDGAKREWGGPASIELFAPSMMEDERFPPIGGSSFEADRARRNGSAHGPVPGMDTRDVLPGDHRSHAGSPPLGRPPDTCEVGPLPGRAHPRRQVRGAARSGPQWPATKGSSSTRSSSS